jgi:TDG/mug DNA glycosylase family protein
VNPADAGKDIATFRREVGPSRAAVAGHSLEAARARTVPDILPAPGEPFGVLFCGINPGLYSAATGWHFARPGNRFWPALHRSGFTSRQLAPSEQDLLPSHGLGITNLVARATAQASELSRAELQAGGARLTELVGDYQPRVVAVAGVTAYRTAFGRPGARVGPQPEKMGDARLWVLPNPSGLNAHWSLAAITDEFSSLHGAISEWKGPV